MFPNKVLAKNDKEQTVANPMATSTILGFLCLMGDRSILFRNIPAPKAMMPSPIGAITMKSIFLECIPIDFTEFQSADQIESGVWTTGDK